MKATQIKDFYRNLIINKDKKLHVDVTAYIAIDTRMWESNKSLSQEKRFKHFYYNDELEDIRERNKRSKPFMKNKDKKWVLFSSTKTECYVFSNINDIP